MKILQRCYCFMSLYQAIYQSCLIKYHVGVSCNFYIEINKNEETTKRLSGCYYVFIGNLMDSDIVTGTVHLFWLKVMRIGMEYCCYAVILFLLLRCVSLDRWPATKGSLVVFSWLFNHGEGRPMAVLCWLPLMDGHLYCIEVHCHPVQLVMESLLELWRYSSWYG